MRGFVFRGRGGHGDRILATTNDRNNWYAHVDNERSVFNPDWKLKRGEIEVLLEEWGRRYAGHLLIEPHVKGVFSGRNKEWPWERWQELVDTCAKPWMQCLPKGKRALDRVAIVETPTFEHAVSLLWHSLGIVTTEGGLHHAAGALNVPAVVIFGAFNRPTHFGYEGHINIEEPDAECLGRRQTHPACIAAMERISVERVRQAVERLWP